LTGKLRRELHRLAAVGADGRGVHLDGLHGVSRRQGAVQAFSSGRLASFQALSPPPSTWACS
jgi:hypothetical protein